MNSRLIQTSDLSLVTTLSLKYPIFNLEKDYSGKVFFYFEKDKSIDDYIIKYWNRDIRVEPLRFFTQLKSIKSRIYQV